MNNFVFDRRMGVRLAVCICLLIPLVLAIIFYFTTDNVDYAMKNTVRLSVTDKKGVVNEFREESIFKLYSGMTEGATEVSSDYKFSKDNSYTVTFTDSNGDKVVYTLYMWLNDEGKAKALYTDVEGKLYIINDEVSEKLIQRAEFSDMNSSKIIPVATFKGLGNAIVIEPTYCDWTYTAFDGNPEKIERKGTASEKTLYFCPDDEVHLEILFDNKPDSIKLKINKGGETVYDGSYEGLRDVEKTALKYSNDTALSLEVEAKWNEASGKKFYGTIKYNANLVYDIAPEYYSVDVANGGITGSDFTVVRIKNFNDGDTLTMKNDFGIDEKVNVYDYAPYDGVPGTKPEFNKLVFIPCKAGVEAGTYTLEFTTGTGRKGTALVKIKSAPEYSSQDVIINDRDLQDAFTEEAISEYRNLMMSLYRDSKNDRLFNDKKFVYPTTGNDSASTVSGGLGYGAQRKVMSIYSTTYTSTGVDLDAVAGKDVLASNDGVVVYADKTTLYGNTVVVDHGLGILTVYGNLDSISVKKGDSVTKKTSVLGKSGSTGFACVHSDAEGVKKTMTHFAFFIGGEFIDPKSPAKWGVNFG